MKWNFCNEKALILKNPQLLSCCFPALKIFRPLTYTINLTLQQHILQEAFAMKTIFMYLVENKTMKISGLGKQMTIKSVFQRV